MTDARTTGVTRATLHPVIIRACVQCGGKREIGKPCAACGLEDPPVVHDLGVQAYAHRSRLKRAWWALWGKHRAARRARAANRYVTSGS